jgi:hypothetical protein
MHATCPSHFILIDITIVIRHYAKSRKVTGSKPEEVNEFFQFT